MERFFNGETMNIEQTEINIAVRELVKDQDIDAALITSYTRETSGIGELCHAFPSFGEKDFFQWLQTFGERGNARILEFGGGVKQQATITTLVAIPGVESFVGYEIKPINPDARQILVGFPQYTNIQGGLSQFDASLVGGNTFDIAFAHNVAEHLPHPFLLLRKLHACLQNGGLVFVNGINLYRDVAEGLFQYWEEADYQFEYKYDVIDRDMKQSNIVRTNVVVQKSSEDIFTPIPTNELLVDYAGVLYPTVIYELP